MDSNKPSTWARKRNFVRNFEKFDFVIHVFSYQNYKSSSSICKLSSRKWKLSSNKYKLSKLSSYSVFLQKLCCRQYGLHWNHTEFCCRIIFCCCWQRKSFWSHVGSLALFFLHLQHILQQAPEKCCKWHLRFSNSLS